MADKSPLQSFGQGASKGFWAGGAGAPVDMLTLALNALIAGGGYLGHKTGALQAPPDLIEKPIGGSEWIAQKMRDAGLLQDSPGTWADALGGVAGNIVGPLAAAKAPQIARGMLQAGENAMAPATLNKQTGAIVWHGSPHKFDKFDSSKIGTGEGAQAYGHGLYLAENPGVARDYRNKLSQNITTADANFNEKSLYEAADSFGETGYPLAFASKYFDLLKSGKSENQAKSQLLKQLEKRVVAAKFPGDVKGAQEAIDFLNSGRAELSGSLYKVDLPDEHIAKMLDWDNAVPESQRAPISQAALKQFGSGSTGTSGEHLYKEVVKEFERAGHAAPKDAATEWLRNQGVPGIRYLDGGSRGAGTGTSNYVVFPGNEDILQILERNGIKP